MDQIHNQVSGDGRLDSDVFYRPGSEEFIKEIDQRSSINSINKLGMQGPIPLGPQGEDEQAQFEYLYKQMQK